MASDQNTWFPLFEFKNWGYQSFLVLPTEEEDAAAPGATVSARKWAKGTFSCGQAFSVAEGYTLEGVLSFAPGLELAVSAKGSLGSGDTLATFEGTGTA